MRGSIMLPLYILSKSHFSIVYYRDEEVINIQQKERLIMDKALKVLAEVGVLAAKSAVASITCWFVYKGMDAAHNAMVEHKEEKA